MKKVMLSRLQIIHIKLYISSVRYILFLYLEMIRYYKSIIVKACICTYRWRILGEKYFGSKISNLVSLIPLEEGVSVCLLKEFRECVSKSKKFIYQLFAESLQQCAFFVTPQSGNEMSKKFNSF